jgi:hypothetical protein
MERSIVGPSISLKCYIYSKTNWNTINKDINTLNEIVEEKQKNGADVPLFLF